MRYFNRGDRVVYTGLNKSVSESWRVGFVGTVQSHTEATNVNVLWENCSKLKGMRISGHYPDNLALLEEVNKPALKTIRVRNGVIL